MRKKSHLLEKRRNERPTFLHLPLLDPVSVNDAKNPAQLLNTGPSDLSLVRQTLSQFVVHDLLRRIKSGELRPGDRLPTEHQLAERFDVSRATVREGFQGLVALGVIDTRPGRGAVVVGLPSEQAFDDEMVSALLDQAAINDLLDFRELVETRLAEDAATRASDEQIAEVQRALEEYVEVATEGTEAYRADVAFHATVAAASNNELLGRVLEAVSDLLISARRRTDQIPGAVEIALQEHKEIADAIVNRDPGRARQAMTQHLESARWASERRIETRETAGNRQNQPTGGPQTSD